jgi:FtsP/CotA-like multicopper oxidase with cupredoxin domain
MIYFGALALLGASLSSHAPGAPPPRVTINDNRTPAGTLRNGVLTLSLEVREGEWHPDRDSDPGLVLRTFAERGKAPSIPGPLIRVPAGTEIRATLHNALGDSTIYLHNFSTRGLADTSAIALEPGATREVRFVAGAAGNWYYWGSTRPGVVRRPARDGELNGAFIVDSAGSVGPPRDRVLVLTEWAREPRPGGVQLKTDQIRFTINGRTWPNTERLTYAVGDTLRFRVINASEVPHPMHLHGFYYKVESRNLGPREPRSDPATAPQWVVTERVAPGSAYTMSWVPERAGYWLFHCHNNLHILRGQPLDGSPLTPEYQLHTGNHALELMGGLVMGIEVRPQGPAPTIEAGTRRQLRLLALVDSGGGGSEAEPAYRYVLEENGRASPPAGGPVLPGPLILLKRGEPVSITVVNQLPEPTAVHWHGIELDSYMDGVAGFSGHPGRIAPVIAPRDSFEARFTPPRSGTFIYHPHADEVRQQQAGLSGALLVVDDPAAFDPAHDIVLLLSTPRREADQGDKILLNGSMTPAPLELKAGEAYRFRLIDIHTFRPSMVLRIVRDSQPVTWRIRAKDGMELGPERAVVRPAQQQMGNGETYDFEFTPREPGEYRVLVTGITGAGVPTVLVTLSLRVR